MPNLFPRAQTGRHLYCWYAPYKRIHAVPNSFMLNFPFLWWTLQLLNLAKLDGFSSTQVTQWAVSTSIENMIKIILHIIIIIIGSSSSPSKIMTAVPWVSWSAIITRSATSLCNQTSAVLNTHIRSMRNNIKCEQTFKSWYLTYVIFVHSINSGASVKKLTEGNFFHNQRKKDSWQLCTFVHSVLSHTQCVILHTVCNFTHSV